MSQHSEKIGYGYLAESTYYEEGTEKPQYYGKLTVNDIECVLAGWIREKDGRKYTSLQVSRVISKSDAPPKTDTPSSSSDDVPF